MYWQRKISFEDRVVVEGSETASIDQYGAGPSSQKPALSIISETGGTGILSYQYSSLKTPNQVYMPIFSQFGKIVWQRLFNILQTTALNAYGNIS